MDLRRMPRFKPRNVNGSETSIGGKKIRTGQGCGIGLRPWSKMMRERSPPLNVGLVSAPEKKCDELGRLTGTRRAR